MIGSNFAPVAPLAQCDEWPEIRTLIIGWRGFMAKEEALFWRIFTTAETPKFPALTSSNAQNVLLARHEGEFPTGSDTTLTLRLSDNSATATLALRANNIFLGASDSEDFGGTWCEL